MWNKLTRLRGMSGTERLLIAEAACFLGLARFLIVLVPFRRIAPWLERRPRRRPRVPGPAMVRSVRRAVLTAARHVPWNAACLPQAMAAKFMLARRGCPSTLHLGVARKGADDLIAHAWLEAGNAIVVGEPGVGAVTPIARFG